MSNNKAKSSKHKRIARRLLTWYGKQGRELPWRKTRDPYRIWVSEVMLQQTQVETVIPYYLNFLEKYPDVGTLASASLDEVLKIWENLGYYARARHLHEAAQVVVDRFGGAIPDNWDDLIRLPGVGAYTAGALLSMAFGQAVPAVDGNVRRVLCRLFAVEEPLDRPATQRYTETLADALVPQRHPGRFNQALMDLGAMVCTSRNPRCARCPVTTDCEAYARDLQGRLPLRLKRKAVPHERVVAGTLFDEAGRVLVVQRPDRGLLASLWKFPGGIVRDEESLTDGLKRTIQEELGIEVQSGSLIAVIRHAYTHFRITLHAFRCSCRVDQIRTTQGRKWLWADPDALAGLAFSKADRLIVSHLQATR